MKIFKKLLVLGALLAPIGASSFLLTSCSKKEDKVVYEQDLFGIQDPETGLYADEAEFISEVLPLSLTRILQDDVAKAAEIIKNKAKDEAFMDKLNELRYKEEAILNIKDYANRVEIAITEDEAVEPTSWHKVVNELDVDGLATVNVHEFSNQEHKRVLINFTFGDKTEGKKYYVYFKLDGKRAMGIDVTRIDSGDLTFKHQRAVYTMPK